MAPPWPPKTRTPTGKLNVRGIRTVKLRIISLSLLALGLIAVPALAQTVYSNGPINGTIDAWTINFGLVVSDTFTTTGGNVNGLSFGVWEDPGDLLLTAEVQITSAEAGGTVFSDQVANFTQSDCSGNQYGFNVCTETGSLSPVNLAAGTYWINLDNAVTEAGSPIFWDENDGPSLASQTSVGTIPSESFTVLGGTSTTSGGTVPEPSSVMLLGSGILGLAGVLRRKLF
jgi:hypothetical protein